MKVGDLIKYKGELHIVVGFEQSAPVARPELELVVLHHTKTMKQRKVPMKWMGSLK